MCVKKVKKASSVELRFYDSPQQLVNIDQSCHFNPVNLEILMSDINAHLSLKITEAAVKEPELRVNRKEIINTVRFYSM